MAGITTGFDQSIFNGKIAEFSSGVAFGINHVSFYNGNAERLSTLGASSSLLAASSFSLASDTSGERSSFCQNLLSEMQSDLHIAQLLMEMQAYSAIYKALARASQNPDKSNTIIQKQQAKSDQAQSDARSQLDKTYSDIDYALKTLLEFDSDASIRFKTFKEAADEQVIFMNKQYSNYKSTTCTQDHLIPVLKNKEEIFTEDKDKTKNKNKTINESTNIDKDKTNQKHKHKFESQNNINAGNNFPNNSHSLKNGNPVSFAA